MSINPLFHLIQALEKTPNPKSPYDKIPKGHMWIEGDNRSNSVDSRTYGPVPMGLIEAKVKARLFPFAREKAWNAS